MAAARLLPLTLVSVIVGCMPQVRVALAPALPYSSALTEPAFVFDVANNSKMARTVEIMTIASCRTSEGEAEADAARHEPACDDEAWRHALLSFGRERRRHAVGIRLRPGERRAVWVPVVASVDGLIVVWRTWTEHGPRGAPLEMTRLKCRAEQVAVSAEFDSSERLQQSRCLVELDVR